MEVKNDILIKNIKFYILSKIDDIFMNGHLYIGKSYDLTNRFKQHYKGSKFRNEKVYKHIRDNGGIDNWTMTLIKEHVYTGTKEEIRKLVAIQERLYLDKYKATLNKCRPFVSNDERLELSRKRSEYLYKNDPEFREKKNTQNKIRQKNKYQNDPEYRDKIKEKVKIRQNFRYQNDPEYRADKKARSKEYYNNKKNDCYLG